MTDPINERRIGYCTNVHPGMDLSGMMTNIGRCAPLIRTELADEPHPFLGLDAAFVPPHATAGTNSLAPEPVQEP